MSVAHCLIIGVAGVCKMLVKVIDGQIQILRVDDVLPLAGQLFLLIRIVPEGLPEFRAHPFILRVLEIPVPDSIQHPLLNEFENGCIRLYQIIQFLLQIIFPVHDVSNLLRSDVMYDVIPDYTQPFLYYHP